MQHLGKLMYYYKFTKINWRVTEVKFDFYLNLKKGEKDMLRRCISPGDISAAGPYAYRK